MELPQIFSKIKRDIFSSTVLTPDNQLKVNHILKKSFGECLRIEENEVDIYKEPCGTASDDDFKRVFGDIFSK